MLEPTRAKPIDPVLRSRAIRAGHVLGYVEAHRVLEEAFGVFRVSDLPVTQHEKAVEALEAAANQEKSQ